MTANESKSYLPYLNDIVDQDKNTHHNSINKINTDYSALTENTESNPKDPKFKLNSGVRTIRYKNNFIKGYNEN